MRRTLHGVEVMIPFTAIIHFENLDVNKKSYAHRRRTVGDLSVADGFNLNFFITRTGDVYFSLRALRGVYVRGVGLRVPFRTFEFQFQFS